MLAVLSPTKQTGDRTCKYLKRGELTVYLMHFYLHAIKPDTQSFALRTNNNIVLKMCSV